MLSGCALKWGFLKRAESELMCPVAAKGVNKGPFLPCILKAFGIPT